MPTDLLEPKIHPTAVVDPEASLAPGVMVGPYAVIGAGVTIGPNCWIGPHAVLEGRLTMGRDNRVFPGACLGMVPQDLKYQGSDTEVCIGDCNTFREYVTVNRATEQGQMTQMGDGNLLMAYCHIAHNCILGNGIIMSNAVQVAGHVSIHDSAVIGGALGIHQFVQIGSLAMVGGMSRVDRDIPPYCMVEGHPARVRGLNKVGLQRSGLARIHGAAYLQDLQDIWKLFYRSEMTMAQALEQGRNQPWHGPAATFLHFIEHSLAAGRRGPIPAARG
ncbi:MAG: UDP-N-acetylglucosamine acyltransferase [Candidatus Synechococcus spongiarum SP3]|uniref:UDP-N-acetylglucosamine acyltransferase n=1 Tax=Candidatus Synechococcus spongiarum SP3 TaxID=1604020 RepID=A0A0G2HME5_9SYNE|nr:MAG: UDP-N-acetylglucosamine acyltransferase [Candidatus Synechococcus spongiarum SP3]